jgi:hypothetical protein
LVELGHYEFAVAEGFGAGEAAVAGAQHDFDQLMEKRPENSETNSA